MLFPNLDQTHAAMPKEGGFQFVCEGSPHRRTKEIMFSVSKGVGVSREAGDADP